MNKLREWWLKMRRKEILVHGAEQESLIATDTLLSQEGPIGSPGGGVSMGSLGAAGGIDAMGDLQPRVSTAIGDTSAAITEDYPDLDPGAMGVVHAPDDPGKLAAIDGELGIPADGPADVGQALQQDVDKDAGDLAKWREEDEKAGRTES